MVAGLPPRGGLVELWMVWMVGEGGEEFVSALDGLLLGCLGGRERVGRREGEREGGREREGLDRGREGGTKAHEVQL